MNVKMGRKAVTILRDAHHGDHGYNAAKGRMVIIDIPGEGRRCVPFASLEIKGEPKPEPKVPVLDVPKKKGVAPRKR